MSVAEILAKLEKDHDLRIDSLSNVVEDVDAISTGNIAIDYITAVGGFARGRSYEIFGPPSSGKTTLALQVAAQAQQRGLRVLYMDFEQALDRDYCRALGMDIDDKEKFLLGQPDFLEQGFDAINKLVSTGEMGLVICDSVASMTPQDELNSEAGSFAGGVALRPRLLAQELRKLNPLLKNTNTCAIYLNHVGEAIPSSYAEKQMASRGIKQTYTPGGKALTHYCSVRVEFKPSGVNKEEEINPLTGEKEKVRASHQTKVQIVKNKVGPPFRTAELRVLYGKGFDQYYSVAKILIASGFVKKGGAGWYTLPSQLTDSSEEHKIQGEDNLIEYLREVKPSSAEVARQLLEQIK